MNDCGYGARDSLLSRKCADEDPAAPAAGGAKSCRGAGCWCITNSIESSVSTAVFFSRVDRRQPYIYLHQLSSSRPGACAKFVGQSKTAHEQAASSKQHQKHKPEEQCPNSTTKRSAMLQSLRQAAMVCLRRRRPQAPCPTQEGLWRCQAPQGSTGTSCERRGWIGSGSNSTTFPRVLKAGS